MPRTSCVRLRLMVLLALFGGLKFDCAASEVKDLVATVLDAQKDKDERIQAAGELGDMSEDAAAAVPKLIPLIHDAAVGAAVTEALGDIGEASAPAVPELIKAMEQDKEEIASEAAWALGGIGPEAKAAIPALIAGVDKPHLLKPAAWALGMIGPESKAAVPKLCALLQHQDATVRRYAISSLGRIGPAAKEAVPLLLPHAMMKVEYNADRANRRAAIIAVAEIGPDPKDGVPFFVGLLQDPDWTVRVKALEGLGRLGPAAKDAAPELVKVLKGRSDRVMAQVYAAYQRIEPNEGARVTVFMDLVRTGKENQILPPLEALQEIGAGAIGELMKYTIELDVQEVGNPEDQDLKNRVARVRGALDMIKAQILAEAERLRKEKDGKTGPGEAGKEDEGPKDSAVVPPPAPHNEGE